ncbi:hypothetical protein GCM10009716_07870 [Streptomyces sodiiphilus]|uniref:TIGR02679 family protein n=1 Tax=Streptomyces sodiiphilus TaxID=226217 RepID=A0ABN2NT36_9ACTN
MTVAGEESEETREAREARETQVVDLPRLRRLLGTPELAWLIDRARRRMARGETLDATVTLRPAGPAQRAAAERLLGRAPRPGAGLTVSLGAVDALLRRAEICPGGLAEAVTALTGEVSPLREERRRVEEAWRRAHAPLAAECARRPGLAAWYEGLPGTGLVRRLSGNDPDVAAPMLSDLAAVLRELPHPGTELAVLAARVCGDAHALDQDRPLATLALGAVRALTGAPAGSGAEWRRSVWAAAGLFTDELSSTVLTLGLPGDRRGAVGRSLEALRAAGQPAVLTLRQLTRDAPHISCDVLFVCENPSVVSAAADQLGPGCVPLVCTQGQPGTAAVTLLRRAADAGARLLYHGDFDWGGLRIANTLLRRVPWQPWHYDSAAYRAALPKARGPLTGTPATADWDDRLAGLMAASGVRVEEELVLDRLLPDLAR